jgi:uncharacterized protein (TIGR04255 family)
MAINEVFVNPTVKQVIFQIIFPNLFYMENKIGEFQLKIMKEFPESILLHRKQFTWADVGPDVKLSEIESQLGKETTGQKIWQFKSQKNFVMNVQSNSLDITSNYHKTYNLEGGDKFRDIIEFVLVRFFEVISLPIINRIGLRYIDECPIPSMDNSTFSSFFNSTFPINRFNLSTTTEMDFKVVVKRGDYSLRYVESLRKDKEKYKLILDFDGFATTIDPQNYLSVTDNLHELIADEYEKTIKEPVKDYMRRPKEG